MAIVSAAVAITLLVVSAFVVDFGMTWERRGQLQSQADKAAIFAAQALPATDAATRERAAKRVAYYLACNTVTGQRVLNVALPDCPGSTTSPDLDAYAGVLLTSGLVSFPSSTQVQVITPTSEVKFAFAGAVGVEDTTQAKSAIAKVSSPGELLPIGLSLQCLAGIVNQAGLGAATDGLLPLSYVTPGSTSSAAALEGVTEPEFEPWGSAYTGTNASTAVEVHGATRAGNLVTVTASSPALLPNVGGILGDARLVFKRGTTSFEAGASDFSLLGGGTVTAPIPAEVVATPGVWRLKVRLPTISVLLAALNPKWSQNDTTLTIFPSDDSVVGRLRTTLSDMLDLPDTVACARLLDSPRPKDGGSPPLVHNLQEGLDHALTANQALVQALGTQNLSGVLNGSASTLFQTIETTVKGVISDPTYSLLGCAGSTYNRLDTVASYQATQVSGGAPANCVRIATGADTEAEFTAGLLKSSPSTPTEPGYGRLSCSREGACEGATTTLPGLNGTFNNDSFSDFLVGDGNTALDKNLAFALDTYLLPHLPVVTPTNNKVEADLYSSPRFGWAPVLSYADLNSGSPADYPILTFRPVFIDNGSAPDLKIFGLNAGRVVDGLAPYLREAVEAALEEVRNSLGLLGDVLNTLLGPLGVNSALTALGLGDVNDALDDLGDGLGLDMGQERAGLVLQDGKLKAARFMTIAPGSLPLVPEDYDGPVMDYVGVGPKIVRLVK